MGYIERAMFIVGHQGTGKTTLIRNALDSAKTWKKDGRSYLISSDRSLFVRTSSWHEQGKTMKEFLDSITKNTCEGRWNILCPMQPFAYSKMPDASDAIIRFAKKFTPEHIRVCLLHPSFNMQLEDGQVKKLISDFKNIPKTECISLDVRKKNKNNLVVTDFFDFT